MGIGHPYRMYARQRRGTNQILENGIPPADASDTVYKPIKSLSQRQPKFTNNN